MAGSFSHCKADNGEFRFDLIENMGDAHGACEDMYWMILVLAEEAGLDFKDLDTLETEVIQGRRPGDKLGSLSKIDELEKRVRCLEDFVRESINDEVTRAFDAKPTLTPPTTLSVALDVIEKRDKEIEKLKSAIAVFDNANLGTAVHREWERELGNKPRPQERVHPDLHEGKIPMRYRWEKRGDDSWFCRPPGSIVHCATVYPNGNWCTNAPDTNMTASALITTAGTVPAAKFAAVAACKVSGWWRAEKLDIDYTKCGLDAARYSVVRDNGEPVSSEARFFVLRYDKNDVWGYRCRVALIDFAAAIADDYPLLSEGLRADVTKYEGFAIKALPPSEQQTKLEIGEVARASFDSVQHKVDRETFVLTLKDGRVFMFGKILFRELWELKQAGAVEVEIERIESERFLSYRATGYDEHGEIVKLDLPDPDPAEDDDN